MQAIISVLLILASVGVVVFYIATMGGTNRSDKLMHSWSIPIGMVIGALDAINFGTGSGWMVIGIAWLMVGALMCAMQFELHRAIRHGQRADSKD